MQEQTDGNEGAGSLKMTQFRKRWAHGIARQRKAQSHELHELYELEGVADDSVPR